VGDEDGTDRFAGKSFDELARHFRTVYPAITPDAIDEYEARYRGSDEEVADLVSVYKRFGGSMQHVTSCVLFAEESDLSRFKLIIDAQVRAGVLTPTAAYAKFRPPAGPSTEEVMRSAKAKLEARRRARASGGDCGSGNADGAGGGGGAGGSDEASLFAVIRGRQASRAEAFDAQMDALAAKCAPPPRKGKSKSSARVKAAGKNDESSPARGLVLAAAAARSRGKAARGVRKAGNAAKGK